MRKYFDDTLNIIRERYPNEASDKIAKELNIPISTIYALAFKMGIKKTQEFLNSEASGRLRTLSNNARIHCFKKGHIPANKGKKMSPEIKAKCAHTFFQKGNKPHNTKNKFDISIRKDTTGIHYAHIKISDGNWELYHRWIYEKEVGKIPEGMVIRFKDGNSLNFDLSNMELISKSENLYRNHPSALPPELKEIAYLKMAIVKKVNKILKNQNDGKKQNE